MMKKLMLGASISALMLGGAFAQAPTTPAPNDQNNPPAAAPAKPDAAAPTTKMNKQPAATPESSAQNKSDKAETNNQAAATTGNEAAGEPKIVATQTPDQLLASKFTGTDVIGANGKKVGDVSDILFTKDGTIKAYVVSFGGFLGIGAKEVAIAPSAFQVMPGKEGNTKTLKLAMNMDALKSAPKFTAYNPPKPASPSGASTVGSGATGAASTQPKSDGM